MPEDADDKDIKAAYRQAALAYHPDRIPEGVSKSMREDAAQKWVEIQEAFAVLSDPEKRDYDTLLEEMRQSEEVDEQTSQQQYRALINVKANFKKKTQERTQGTHKPVTREKVATSAVPAANGFIVQPLEPSKHAHSAIGPNKVQGWIGVTTTHFGRGGAVLTAAAPGSPAAKAGLRPGDVINAVNGISLRDKDLDKNIAAYKPGSALRLGYMRGAWALESVVTVATNPR